MNGFASRGRRPHPFDLLLVIASFAVVLWALLPH